MCITKIFLTALYAAITCGEPELLPYLDKGSMYPVHSEDTSPAFFFPCALVTVINPPLEHMRKNYSALLTTSSEFYWSSVPCSPQISVMKDHHIAL